MPSWGATQSGFGPEKVDDYFLGMKSTFEVGGRRATFNIEGFWDDYKGAQRAFLTLALDELVWFDHCGLAAVDRDPRRGLQPRDQDEIRPLGPAADREPDLPRLFRHVRQRSRGVLMESHELVFDSTSRANAPGFGSPEVCAG